MSWWREPTRGQWCSFLAAWVGWVLDAFDFTIFLLVMPRIAAEFHVGVTAAATSVTLTLLVRLLGGVAAGAAADRFGRKLPLMISLVWFAVCDGLVAVAPSFAWILVLRTIFGFGMGAEWTSGATLAMENWPAKSRGIASGVLQGSWAVGYLLAATAAAEVLPRWGWRGLFVLAAAPALLVLPVRIWVPESPAFLEERARRRASGSASPGAPAPKPALDRHLLARVAWGSAVMALGFGAYYGLTGLYPTLVAGELGRGQAGVPPLVALFNVGMLAGAVLCGVLAARRGVALAVAIPAALSLLALPLYVGLAPSLLAVGALLAGMLGAGFSGVVPMFLTDLFPAEVRARAVGVVYHVGAFFAAFVPTGIAALHQYGGVTLAHAILYAAGACELALAASFFTHALLARRAAPPARAALAAAA